MIQKYIDTIITDRIKKNYAVIRITLAPIVIPINSIYLSIRGCLNVR